MKIKNILWGMFFILSAGLIILNQMDILIGVGLVSLIITLLMVPIVVKSFRHRIFSGVVFPIAIAGILFDSQLGIQKLTPWPLLGVALFLIIGLSIMIPPKKYKNSKSECNFDFIDNGEIFDAQEGNVVNIDARFTGINKYIKSTNLKMVNINSSFAGVEVYLDGAEIDGDVLIMNINARFSGVTLYIPRTWLVDNQANAIFAGFDDKKRRYDGENTKKLIIKGEIELAGVEIKYV